MNRNPDIAELLRRINNMQEAIQPLLDGDKVRNARWEEWKYNVVHAAWRERGNKRSFYRMRVIALVASISVPSLVGLNLAGTGGSVVRWLTFALSLVAAIATGIIALYRVGDRWLMYRRLMDNLMVIGYTLVDSSSANPQQEQAAHVFKQIGRLARAALENVSLNPGLALGQETPERRSRLSQFAHRGVETGVAQPRQRRQPVHE